MKRLLLMGWLLLTAGASCQPSRLVEFYQHKYLPQERQSASRGLAAVLPGWAATATSLAVEDILTYHRVIYHANAYHDLLRNLAVVARWRPTIATMCHRYGVP